MKIANHDVGLCSWSVHPKDTADLVAKLRQVNLNHVQLGLQNLLMLDDKRKHQELGHLRAAGIVLTGTMLSFPGEDYSTFEAIRRTGGFVPDEQWPLRRQLAKQAAQFTADLGVKSIGTHVGFVPHASDAGYAEARERVRGVAADFAAEGIDLLMETGQESAVELLEFLHDLAAPNVFINFDPANMILYGAGDPIEALRVLGKYVRHVHVKDATPSGQPGKKWGAEVPFGEGMVGPKRFLNALKEIGYAGPLVIEREAGDDRVGDVQKGINALRAAAAIDR